MSVPNCDLSFDPADPYVELPGTGVSIAVQVFTTVNGYGLDRTRVTAEATARSVLVTATGFARLGQQAAAGDGLAVIKAELDDGVWTFRIDARHREPIKSVKLILRGLPDGALRSGWWSPTTPDGAAEHGAFQWNYPGPEWATPWAAAGGVALSIRPPTVAGVVLHVGRPGYADATEAELVYAVPASDRHSTVAVPEIRLRIDDEPSAVRQDLAAHIADRAAVFRAVPWEERDDVPAWARDLRLVLTLHGQHWTGHVFHDFAGMEQLLERAAELVTPSSVLVYLPGWEGRYYFDYPHYVPGRELGGREGFSRLVHRAHQLGFRIMPMFGANGANARRWPGWEHAAIRNDTDLYPIMLNAPDWDGDRHPETDQVFLNPGKTGFRAHLVDAVSAMVTEFGVDAAFFDTAGFWFDDPRAPLYEGYRALTAELRERHPQLLLVSEGWWDAMTALFPMSQQWLGVERDVRHPELLTRFARTTSHLAEGTPGRGSTGVHEEGFRARPPERRIDGHIPVVSFAGGDGAEQLALLAGLLEERRD